MSTGRSHVRLRNLLQLFTQYDGSQPLHLYLQEQFRKHKEWGSSDRRFYREYLYASMRLGRAFPIGKPAERFLLTAWLRKDLALFEDWKKEVLLPAADTTQGSGLFPEYQPGEIFPFSQLISARLDKTQLFAHLEALLPVYARILPKAEKGTMILPPDATLLPDNALRLPAGSDLSQWTEDGFLQVQDLGSQQVCRLIEPETGGLCWDMCCGAGGKSLYLAEKTADGELFCSDLRSSILENLAERFHAAGLPQPWVSPLDMSLPGGPDTIAFRNKNEELKIISKEAFATIVADVPCSGSGTWSRNPENLCFYPDNSQTPEEFAALQQRLVRNAWPFLKAGGRLHYITCSVYATENEDNARMLCEELGGIHFQDQYALGYQQASDTLYHAVWEKT